MTAFVPARPLVTAFVAATVVSLAAVLDAALAGLVVGIDVVIVLAAGIDALRTTGVALDVERSAPRIWSIGRPETVRLRVRTGSRRSLSARLDQTLFEGAEAEGLPAVLRLRPGRVEEVECRVVARRRGAFALGAHHVRVSSPWGLWERQVDLRAHQPVEVWPDVKALTEYDLLARAGRQNMLVHVIRRPGALAEFEHLRPWQTGDEYRLVDWKATARSRGPIVRRLREATDQNVVFLLDLGRTMTAEHAGRTALDWALDAVLLTAHVALRHGDRVGLVAFDDRIRAVLPPRSGAASRRALLSATCRLQPSLDEPDWTEAFAVLRRKVRSRSLVVLVTNLLDDATAELFGRLIRSSRQHLVAWVSLRDPTIERMADAPASDAEVPWTRAAAAEVLAWRAQMLDRAARRGVLVVDAEPREMTPRLLARYLDAKARNLL